MDAGISSEQLRILLDTLVILGENKEEMDYWRDIFFQLPAEYQKRLWRELDQERKALSRLSGGDVDKGAQE